MPLGGIFLQGAPWQAQAEEGVELAEISQFLQGCGVVCALLWQRGSVVWGPVLPTFWFQQRGAGTYPEWDIPMASVGCLLAAGCWLWLCQRYQEWRVCLVRAGLLFLAANFVGIPQEPRPRSGTGRRLSDTDSV